MAAPFGLAQGRGAPLTLRYHPERSEGLRWTASPGLSRPPPLTLRLRTAPSAWCPAHASTTHRAFGVVLRSRFDYAPRLRRGAPLSAEGFPFNEVSLPERRPPRAT